MTSREVVTRAIEFRTPPRLPIFGYGPLSDFVNVPHEPVKPPQADEDPLVDQWLCRWHKTSQPNMGQVKSHPLEDLERMKEYPWPDGNDPRRYANTPAALAAIAADPAASDRYAWTSIFMILWERMHSLHGFENCMVGLLDDDPRLHELADRILDFDLAVVRNMHRLCGSRIQGFHFTEDWGTQTDLMIAPALWRGFFLPRYKRLFAAIHDCGWHVRMHSCGKVNKAIEGLIEAGLDVINLQQPLTTGIEEVGRQFAGRICFETQCDIQRTLPGGDRQAIELEAQRLLHTWGTPAGGFILGDYGDDPSIGVPPGARAFMLDTFRRLDPYRTGWET